MKQVIKNIFIILNPWERSMLIRLILLDLLVSILDISFLAALIYIVHFYTGAAAPVKATIFPLTLFGKHSLLPIILFFILFGIKNFFGFLIFRKQSRFVYAVASRLSKNNVEHYFNGSYSDYVNIDSSVHIRRISQGPIEFSHYILYGFQQVTGQAILILVTIIAILTYNPILFPLLFCILVPPILLAVFLMKRKLNTIRKTTKPLSEKMFQYLKEALSAFIESNIYDRKGFFINRYYNFQSEFNRFQAEQQSTQHMPSRLMEVFAIFGLFILILINKFITQSSEVSLITIGAFMAAAYKIIPGIVKILNSTSQMRTFSFTIHDLLQTNVQLKSKPVNETGRINTIELTDVSFRYKDQYLLNNFSVVMKSGDLIGLSGLSGKGKTTLVNILLGFLHPDSGSITMNGKVTTADERQAYWKNIAYVKQQPLLIQDTVANNITLDENISNPQRLNSVIKVTGLEAFINSYPEGLSKLITENGKNISGGQRQRIAIARALYKDADCIILDEPFNELDRSSVSALLDHFRQLAASGKLVVLITHDTESLSFCSKIVSMDEK